MIHEKDERPEGQAIPQYVDGSKMQKGQCSPVQERQIYSNL